MRARCGRISRPLFEKTLSSGADKAGMQNNDSKSDLKSGYWSHSADSSSWPVGMIQLSSNFLALPDVSGFRKLFQNRNITTTRTLNESDYLSFSLQPKH